MLVILAVAVPLGVLPTLDAIQHSPVHSLLGIVALVAYIVAAILLFRRESSDWFKVQKSSD